LLALIDEFQMKGLMETGPVVPWLLNGSEFNPFLIKNRGKPLPSDRGRIARPA
jgi:hypothetical protein